MEVERIGTLFNSNQGGRFTRQMELHQTSALHFTGTQMDTLWLSEKGIRYCLAPKRGAWVTINPDVASSLTAKWQDNWIGTFVSPDILSVERTNKQGGTQPTKITLRGGKRFTLMEKNFIAVIKTYSDAWGGCKLYFKGVCPPIQARDYKDPMRIVYADNSLRNIKRCEIREDARFKQKGL